MRRLLRTTAAGLGVLGATLSWAQPDRTGRTAGLTPVEQTVGDVGPLSTSLRIAPADMRVPMDFDRVYRVPWSIARPGGSGGAGGERLARVSGGITAVFPVSEYGVTSKGRVVPLVPAGTVFHIGTPPEARGEGPVRRASVFAVSSESDNTVSTAARAGVASVIAPERGGTVEVATAGGARATHVMSDEAYRRQRVREMFARR
jgi:hypothetical protein